MSQHGAGRAGTLVLAGSGEPAPTRPQCRPTTIKQEMPLRKKLPMQRIKIRRPTVRRANATVKFADRAPPVRAAAMAATHREAGTELVWSGVTTGSNTKLFGMAVAPSTLGPRIARLSTLYEKYTINSLTFTVQIAGSLTTAVQLVQALDTDAGDADPVATLDGIKSMLSWRHSQLVTFLDSSPHALPIVIRQPEAGFYTSYDAAGDLRLSFCGQYYLYSMTGSANVTATVVVHYDITFFEPQIGDSAGSAVEVKTLPVCPTTANAWDDLAIELNKLAAVPGVLLHAAAGHIGLRLSEGTYYLTQNYLPTSIPGAPAGFGPPVLTAIGRDVLGVVANVIAGIGTVSPTIWGTNLIRYIVPAGTFAYLFGAFINNYVDGGAPHAWLSISRV